LGTIFTKKNVYSTFSFPIAYFSLMKEEMQDALRDIFGPMFEAMLQGEMDSHLGYGSNDRGAKNTSNRRNGYTEKSVKSSI